MERNWWEIPQTPSTAIAQQFANDWLLVIENDQECWNKLIENTKDADCDPVRMTAILRDEWDTLVDQMAEVVEDKVSEIGALLLRQMLVMGDYPFQLIANQVISSIKETEATK